MSKKKPSPTGSASGRKAPILVPSRLLESDRHQPVEDRAKLIQDLADLLRKNNLSELEFEREGLRVRLRQEYTTKPAGTVPSEPVVGQTPSLPSYIATPPADTRGLVTITSPIVGTFYRSPAPDADPYVEEGDTVKKGQVLCIVEAMKLMNEIESEVDGRVVKILVESAKPVEYGQPLFLIEPTPAA
ncbi:MAG: acetyl-CoA carboxylase biotin carboxyl carrier protein [Nitrospiraceae bacterium]